MFLNESEDTRNVLGEFQRLCKRWTSITDPDFAAVENTVSPLFESSGPSFILLQVLRIYELLNHSGKYFLPSNSRLS